MKIPRVPHSWRISPRAAISLQRRLAAKVLVERPGRTLRHVAGLDAAFDDSGKTCVAAVVLWDLPEQQVLEYHLVRQAVFFPYVPGLLSFREAPALLAALRKLDSTPDVLMCDGHGFAHPRRFGIACHVGVLSGLPTIGCAKSRLVGVHDEPALRRGSCAALRDADQAIGEVLRTQDAVRPVYVSVGHMIDPVTVRELVLQCAVRFRLPEPTRLADRLVAAAKRHAPLSPRDRVWQRLGKLGLLRTGTSAVRSPVPAI